MSDECVIDLFEYFNIGAKANDLKSTIKLTCLPLYIKNTAYWTCSMFIVENTNLKFEEVKYALKTKFASSARNGM